jgi:hypothetical protein
MLGSVNPGMGTSFTMCFDWACRLQPQFQRHDAEVGSSSEALELVSPRYTPPKVLLATQQQSEAEIIHTRALRRCKSETGNSMSTAMLTNPALSSKYCVLLALHALYLAYLLESYTWPLSPGSRNSPNRLSPVTNATQLYIASRSALG